MTPVPTELSFGWLHRGEAFALALLREDPNPEDVHRSEAAVRVESCTCRLLVLTRGCLIYLPDDVARSALMALDSADDPIRV
eukprot:CAMPEP_0176307746 /NCGR_PEP_ID=MMETSP0121_2-20121125/64182_1 /TAXON_ID=160619 /ORGANISM="Kryptoperidinium foliaceum, Strain CCMP 1326" /LENGTH=81 /DNA_ID=CAMNT_0017649547 /DNA_START=32 /DNA_END=274 /DNA_ORIENTATION=+